MSKASTVKAKSSFPQEQTKNHVQPFTLPGIGQVLTVLVVSVVAILVLLQFGRTISAPPFSHDSWSYFELSQTIWTQFYQVHTIRQFEFVSSYGVSFPPLFPLVISLVNLVWPIGIYAGWFLNLVILLSTLGMCIAFMKVLKLHSVWGVILFLCIAINPSYIDEAVAGRTIPLSLLILLGMGIVVCQQRQASLKQAVGLGCLAGLGVLNRFDLLPFSLALGVALWIVGTPSQKWRVILGYYLTLLVFLSPWIWYSWSHFHRLFVSDNSRTLLLAFPSYTVDYFPPGNHVATLLTSPLLWLRELGYRVAHSSWNLVTTVFFHSLVGAIGLGELLSLVGIHQQKHLTKKSHSILGQLHTFWATYRLLLLFWFSLISQVLLIVLTGYDDRRYFIPFLTLSYVILFLLYVNVLKPFFSPLTQYLILIGVVFILLMKFESPRQLVNDISFLHSHSLQFNTQYLQATQYQLLTTALSRLPQPKILIEETTERGGGLDAFEFGATTHVATVITPLNSNPCTLQSLIDQYHITAVYTTCSYWESTLQSNYQVASNSSVPHLYLLSGRKTPAPNYATCALQPDQRDRACGLYVQTLALPRSSIIKTTQ